MPDQQDAEEHVQVQTSVLVVSHNRREALQRLLASLEQSVDRERIEILVVDNASTDGSAQLDAEFPNVRLIRLPRNFGLTKALNIGVRAAAGEFVMFLHDDTDPAPDAVSRLAGQLAGDPEAAAACPLLVNSSDAPAPQLRDLPAPGNLDAPWVPAHPSEAVESVDYPTGAALLIRKHFLQAMRHIDERYGQFWSDAEICRQVRHAGKKILLVSQARVKHAGGREPATELEIADRALGAAKFLGKHYGLVSGLKYRIGAILSALAGLHLGRVGYLLSGQKIDGSQAA